MNPNKRIREEKGKFSFLGWEKFYLNFALVSFKAKSVVFPRNVSLMQFTSGEIQENYLSQNQRTMELYSENKMQNVFQKT